MSAKLSLAEELRALDYKDPEWYQSLSDSEKKEVSLWVLMRYMSSVDSRDLDTVMHHLLLVNECANVHYNSINRHPELQYRLLQVAGTGRSQNHKWIKPPAKAKKNKLAEWLSEIYPSYNDDEIDLLISVNTKDNLKDLARSHGMQDKEITALFK
jgi:hypothetical protein